ERDMARHRTEAPKRRKTSLAARGEPTSHQACPGDATARCQDIASGSCGPPLENRYHQPHASASHPATAPLKIIYRAPGELQPRAVNPRTHTPKQIKQV